MRRALFVMTAALAAAGCGDSKDWEQEVTLQLFRPERADVGAVTVRVTEGGKTVEKSFTVGSALTGSTISFADCDKNRVRIIPRKDGPGYAAVDITVLFGLGTRRDAKPVDGNPVPVPPPGVVKIVLDTGVINPNLEPKACAPPIVPPVKRPLGSSCGADSECEGGKCLADVPDLSSKQLFPKGYCTFKCEKNGNPCDNGRGFCKLYTDAAVPTPNEYGPYCIRRCKDCAPSVCLPCDRLTEGYACSTFDLCYPK